MGKYDAAEDVLAELKRMPFLDMTEAFDEYSIEGVLKRFSLEEIDERIKAIKKEKESIRIGDEISYVHGNSKFRIIVFFKEKDVDGREYFSGLNTYKPRCSNGGCWGIIYADHAVKTGEHYDLSYLLTFIRDDFEDDDNIEQLLKDFDEASKGIDDL